MNGGGKSKEAEIEKELSLRWERELFVNGVFVDVNYSMMYFERWWWSPLETAFRRYKRPEELAESFCEFREERIKLLKEESMRGPSSLLACRCDNSNEFYCGNEIINCHFYSNSIVLNITKFFPYSFSSLTHLSIPFF